MSPVNSANIDVLAERVDTFLNQSSKIEGMIQGISSGQQSLVSQIAVFQERMAQIHLTQQRLNNILDSQGERIDKVQEDQKKMGEDISNMRQLWKIVGSVSLFLATAALGLAGWLNNTVGITERRTAIIEYSLGIRNVLVPPSQPAPGVKP